MIIKLAKYTIKPEALDIVLSAIDMFVKAIRDNEPETFYEAYRKNDTMEFVHLMKFADEVAEKKHSSASYTKDFVSILYPNCVMEPEFIDLDQII